MIVQDKPTTALSYCLNVHAGESWDNHFHAIQTHALAVRDRVAPDRPFGLGLRVSAAASRTLREEPALATFQSFMREHNLFAFTINGFPFGRFHGGRVKERVYQPDWMDDARVRYTTDLADILSRLLPDDMDGSISTVPGAYRALVRHDRDADVIAGNLARVAAHLARVRDATGRLIHLGLEPEPDCYMETAPELIHFFEHHVWRHGRDALAQERACSANEAEAILRTHIGACLDTCHAALVFEDPAETIAAYQAAGVRISKIQISAALETANTEAGRMALRPFDEPVYLHQVKGQHMDGTLQSWRDLPDALVALPRQPMIDTVRIHFHVPLFWNGDGPLASTTPTLTPAFWQAARAGACPHLEIETYTFDVLPEAMRTGGIDASVSAEFAWVLNQWHTNK
jgi:sugar phosphate isomerase/epimerase